MLFVLELSLGDRGVVGGLGGHESSLHLVLLTLSGSFASVRLLDGWMPV